jgi:hypothetical protein
VRMFLSYSQIMWARSHVVWARGIGYSQLIWAQIGGCYRARRVMFSGRYSYLSNRRNGILLLDAKLCQC